MTKKIAESGLWSIFDNTYTRQEYGDYKVGDKLSFAVQMLYLNSFEITNSKNKSIKQVDLGIYEATGQLRYYPKCEAIVLDCGIYAYAEEWPKVKNLRNGSSIKTRFKMAFEDGYDYGYDYSGFKRYDPKFPNILYNWEIIDILVNAKTPWDGKVYFEKLPVEHIRADGSVFKRIQKTDGNNDCGGDTSYLYLCKKLD